MKRRNAIIALVLVGVMFFSIFAYAILQSFFYSPPQQQISLPDRIVTRQLTSQQRQQILQQGGTIASFKYDVTCLECGSIKSYLESMVRSPDYRQQIFLEELTGFSTTSLEVSSPRGSKMLANVTQYAISDSMCNLLVQPPVSCALRKV
jgi:hypothetical protein